MELEKLEIRAKVLLQPVFGTMCDHAALPKARSGNRGCRGEAHPPATVSVAVVDSRDFIAAIQTASGQPKIPWWSSPEASSIQHLIFAAFEKAHTIPGLLVS